MTMSIPPVVRLSPPTTTIEKVPHRLCCTLARQSRPREVMEHRSSAVATSPCCSFLYSNGDNNSACLGVGNVLLPRTLFAPSDHSSHECLVLQQGAVRYEKEKLSSSVGKTARKATRSNQL
ncbi:unnamed protein product [Ectocarpus sp. 13 AM-2016]